MFDFQQTAGSVDGWLTEAEGQSLYEAAKQVKAEQVIVEIGSWKGRSTICIAHGSKDGNQAKVFAIDPHTGSSEHQEAFGAVDTFAEFTNNIRKAGIAECVEPMRMTSAQAARDFHHPVGFVFIDGAHEYRFVKQDMQMWFRKVVNGGALAFHDSWHFPGPHLATAGMLLFSSRVRNPRLVDTMTFFEKVEKNSWLDRIANIGFVFYRVVFGLLGFLRLKYQS